MRRGPPVLVQRPLGLQELVDPSVLVPSGGQRIGLMTGEGGHRGIDVGHLQGARVRGVPLVHEGGLGLPGPLAQASHPRSGAVARPARAGEHVLLAAHGQIRVADQHHLRAVGQLGVELLQDAPGLRPHARHGHAALDGLALQTAVGRLDGLPAARCAAESDHEAPLHDVREVHVVAADREHHQVGVGRHLADLLIDDVAGRAAAVSEIRQSRVRAPLVEPVHVMMRPAIATAVRLAARIVRVLGLVVPGAAAGRVGVPEQGDVQRHVLLPGIHRLRRRLERGRTQNAQAQKAQEAQESGSRQDEGEHREGTRAFHDVHQGPFRGGGSGRSERGAARTRGPTGAEETNGRLWEAEGDDVGDRPRPRRCR